MEDLASIETTIHHLRTEMVRAYEMVGDLGHETVIALSQELDLYLVMFQQQTKGSQGEAGSSGEDKASIF
ncbi:aspartyl-phosphate phosphatase Spo0E family protein [Tumebacillus flagellatus]|uniref:Spo0E family sporulation regulatory protein-aspartic acid phosphatase n=1 Tax=Tumebacillus flagellatus TaxID=1157490 RepID=UPI0009DF792F